MGILKPEKIYFRGFNIKRAGACKLLFFFLFEYYSATFLIKRYEIARYFPESYKKDF